MDWIITASLENFEKNREHEFRLIGLKERRYKQALKIRVGDRLFFYLTRLKAFGGAIRIESELFESDERIWPAEDLYPWRFRTRPELILTPGDLIPAERLAQKLEHTRKWPAENWTLAFQGQIREISPQDAKLIEKALLEKLGS